MQAQSEINSNMPDKKLYYAMGEVCQMTGVKDTMLRGWEKDFPQLRPKRSKSGARSYREKDIELILYIKHLLQEEQYTVAGARKRIADERRAERTGKSAKSDNIPAAPKTTDATNNDNLQIAIPLETSTLPNKLLAEIKSELTEILKILEKQA